MKKKSLISNLILINSITLFLGFYLIYFSVNYVIKDYVHQMTRNSMQANFTILDSIYNNKKIPDENMVNQDSIFVWSYYAIFDQHYRMKYGTDNHKKRAMILFAILPKKIVANFQGKRWYVCNHQEKNLLCNDQRLLWYPC